jgi:O-antigen ligase
MEATKTINSETKIYKRIFLFAIVYVIVDYARLQDILNLNALRPGMISILILTGYLLASGAVKAGFASKQMKLMVLFIILLAVHIPFARNTHFAYGTTLNMVLMLPFMLAVILCVDCRRQLEKLIFILLCIMIFLSTYSLLHHGMGPGNYFTDENDMALYINMWIPFCYFLFFSEKQMYRKLFYGLGLVVGVASVIVSFSRGGFAGLIGVALICWIFSSKKILSIVLITILSFMVYTYAGDQYWKEMNSTSDVEEGTAKERIELWKSGWDMFLDNPLGVGAYNYPMHLPDYQTAYFKRNMWGKAAHSLWVQLITEVGIFGILIYTMLLFFNFKDVYVMGRASGKAGDDLLYVSNVSRAMLASFVGYFLSGTFLSVLYYPHYWYLTGILIAMKQISVSCSAEIDQKADSPTYCLPEEVVNCGLKLNH